MLKKIEHIGIAVTNILDSDTTFKKLIGKEAYKHEVVEREGVTTSFYQIGETKIELLEATEESSAIKKFVDKRGEGIHHIAFDVDDIQAEMKRLQFEGFTLLSEEPFHGADNKLVCFVHPKSCNGILVELCQERAL